MVATGAMASSFVATMFPSSDGCDDVLIPVATLVHLKKPSLPILKL
jgi:hypothetical protein